MITLFFIPIFTGLFHKAIMESGTIFSGRLLKDPKIYAHRLCEILGNGTKDPESIVKFLRSIDSHKLIEAQNKLKTKEVTCFVYKISETFFVINNCYRKKYREYSPLAQG